MVFMMDNLPQAKNISYSLRMSMVHLNLLSVRFVEIVNGKKQNVSHTCNSWLLDPCGQISFARGTPYPSQSERKIQVSRSA